MTVGPAAVGTATVGSSTADSSTAPNPTEVVGALVQDAATFVNGGTVNSTALLANISSLNETANSTTLKAVTDAASDLPSSAPPGSRAGLVPLRRLLGVVGHGGDGGTLVCSLVAGAALAALLL